MTSAVALALMAKASAVFGGDGTYLSFPLTPISFSKEQLDFLNDAAHPAAALENASQFAFIVNQIPNGPVWPTVDTGPLWQEYSRILKQAQLANEQRTPAEEAQYQAAMRFLYVAGADGLQTQSPAVVAYSQYRDAYLNAKQQYASRKIAADLSADPAVRAQWQTDQAGLQAAVDAALNAWQTLGFKGQVDDARRVQLSLGAKSPAITWSQWAALCDFDVISMTDLENRRFMPTAFAPTSAVDSPMWQQFTLGAGEVAQLVTQAPKELAARLGTDQSLDIASVDFECTSVTITRPWFAPDVFSERFWKLNSAPAVVSDGQTPPGGTIPSYTVAIVFARNLEVKLAAPATASTGADTQLVLGPLHAASIVDVSGNRTQLRSSFVSTNMEPLTLRDDVATTVAVQPTVMRSMVARPMMMERVMTAEPVADATVAEATVADAPVATRSPMMARLQTLDYVRVMPAPPQQQPLPTPPSPPPGQQSSSDEIFVLGFICKAVPPSPNPDTTLSW